MNKVCIFNIKTFLLHSYYCVRGPYPKSDGKCRTVDIRAVKIYNRRQNNRIVDTWTKWIKEMNIQLLMHYD
jgi:hypothetical protein